MGWRVKKIDFKHNLRVYYGFLSEYKIIFILLLFFVLIIEITNVVRTYLFKILTDRGTEFVAGTLIKSELIQILVGLFFAYLLISLVRIISEWFNMQLINVIDSNLIANLKRKFFNHLIHLHYGFHTSHKTGSLISRLVRGSGSIEKITDSIVLNFAPLIFGIIVTGITILYFDKESALIILLTSLVFIGYSLLIHHLQQKSIVKSNENEDYEQGAIGDIFTNIDSIKSFGKELYIKDKYKKLSEITKNGLLDNWGYFRWLNAGHAFILAIGTIALVYFPILKFLNNELSIGTLVFIFASVGNISGLLFRFVYGIRGFYSSMADFQALFKYDKIQNEIRS